MFDNLKEKLSEIYIQEALDWFKKNSLVEIQILPSVFQNFFVLEKAYAVNTFESGLATGSRGWFVESSHVDGLQAVLFLIARQVFAPGVGSVSAGITMGNLADFFEKKWGYACALFVDGSHVEKRKQGLNNKVGSRKKFHQDFDEDILDFYPGFELQNANSILQKILIKAKEESRLMLESQIAPFVKSGNILSWCLKRIFS